MKEALKKIGKYDICLDADDFSVLEELRLFLGNFKSMTVLPGQCVQPESLAVATTVLQTRINKACEPQLQGRINLYANYAMAWGPPRQGGPRGGRHYFSHQYQLIYWNHYIPLQVTCAISLTSLRTEPLLLQALLIIILQSLDHGSVVSALTNTETMKLCYKVVPSFVLLHSL